MVFSELQAPPTHLFLVCVFKYFALTVNQLRILYSGAYQTITIRMTPYLLPRPINSQSELEGLEFQTMPHNLVCYLEMVSEMQLNLQDLAQ